MLRRSLRRLGGPHPEGWISPIYEMHHHAHPEVAKHSHPHVKFFNAAVCLSGAGVFDGTELHEAVACLIALKQNNFNYVCCAPDRNMFHTFNHNTGAAEEKAAPRNILTESARIARGPVTPLSKIDVTKFDALVFPGGFGVMKNLSTYGYEGDKGQVHDDVADLIRRFFDAERPIAAACIAPILVAATLGPEMKAANKPPLRLTLGETEGDAQKLATSFGAVVLQQCEANRSVRCDAHRLLTTPAYMSAEADPATVFAGISEMIRQMRMIVEHGAHGISTVAV